MILRKKVAPLLFFLLGVAGFVLRGMELKTAFEPVNGLCEKWHITSVLTTALAVLAALIAIYIAIAPEKRYSSKQYEKPREWGTAKLIAGIASGSAIILGTILFCSKLWYSTFEIKWLERLCAVLSATGGLCIMTLSVTGGGENKSKISKITSALIPLWLCIWMLYSYRMNAENPVLNAYVWQCLSLMAASLGTFYFASFVYDVPSKTINSAFLLIGEYLCIVSVADQKEIYSKLLFGGIALWLAILSSATIKKNVKS